MRRKAQRRQREEGGSLAVPHQHSNAAAPPAAAMLTAAPSTVNSDRPRRHTAPFLGLRNPKRSTREPLDPETGGERGVPHGQEPQPEQPAPAMNGSLSRGGSNGTEMSELRQQRSDPQSLSRTTSDVRHISGQVSNKASLAAATAVCVPANPSHMQSQVCRHKPLQVRKRAKRCVPSAGLGGSGPDRQPARFHVWRHGPRDRVRGHHKDQQPARAHRQCARAAHPARGRPGVPGGVQRQGRPAHLQMGASKPGCFTCER